MGTELGFGDILFHHLVDQRVSLGQPSVKLGDTHSTRVLLTVLWRNTLMTLFTLSSVQFRGVLLHFGLILHETERPCPSSVSRQKTRSTMAAKDPPRPVGEQQRLELEALVQSGAFTSAVDSILRLEAQVKRFVFWFFKTPPLPVPPLIIPLPAIGLLCHRILGSTATPLPPRASSPPPSRLQIIPLSPPRVASPRAAAAASSSTPTGRRRRQFTSPRQAPAAKAHAHALTTDSPARRFAPAMRRRVPVVPSVVMDQPVSSLATSDSHRASPAPASGTSPASATRVHRRTTMADYAPAGYDPDAAPAATAAAASSGEKRPSLLRSKSYSLFDEKAADNDFDSVEELEHETRGCLERTFFPIDMDSENQEVTYRVPYVMCIYFYASTMGLMACCCLLDGAQVSPLSG